MEDCIKELKGRCGMEQMLTGDLFANALYFAIRVLVYNTTVAQKLLLLLPEEWAEKTIHAMRWALIQVAPKAVRRGRRLTVKLAMTYQKYSVYLYMLQRCVASI